MSSEKFCHHIHQNGTYCQSPPMRDRHYCYTHLQLIGRRMPMAKARARSEKCLLNLPIPEDLHGVQVAIAHLMDDIAADRVDPRRARLLISSLRLAASNLKSKTPWDRRQLETSESTPNRVQADPNFETNYGLPEGLDLDLPPTVVYPPPVDAEGGPQSGGPQLPALGNCGIESPVGAPSFRRSCERVGGQSASNQTNSAFPITVADIALWRHLHEASIAARRPVQNGAADALTKLPPIDSNYPAVRLHHRALELIAEGHVTTITPFDLELMEIVNAEGEAAMLKRARQHDADRRRQEHRRQSRAVRERLAGEARARNAASLASRLLSEPSARSLIAPQPPSPEASAGEVTLIKKKPPQSETSPSEQGSESTEPAVNAG